MRCTPAQLLAQQPSRADLATAAARAAAETGMMRSPGGNCEQPKLTQCRSWPQEYVSRVFLNEGRHSCMQPQDAAAAAQAGLCSPSMLLARIHQQQQLRMPQLSPQQHCSTPQLPPDKSQQFRPFELNANAVLQQQKQQQQQPNRQHDHQLQPISRAAPGGRPSLYTLGDADAQIAAAAAAAGWSSSKTPVQQQAVAAATVLAPQLSVSTAEFACSCPSPKTPALESPLSSSLTNEADAVSSPVAAAAAASCRVVSLDVSEGRSKRNVLGALAFEAEHRGDNCCNETQGQAPIAAAAAAVAVAGEGDSKERMAGDFQRTSLPSLGAVSQQQTLTATQWRCPAYDGSSSSSSSRAAARGLNRDVKGHRTGVDSSNSDVTLCLSSSSLLLSRLSPRLLTSVCCSFLPLRSLVAISTSCRALLQVSIHHKWVDRAVRRGALQDVVDLCRCCCCMRKKSQQQRDRQETKETQTSGKKAPTDISSNSVSAALRGFGGQPSENLNCSNSSNGSIGTEGDRDIFLSALVSSALKTPLQEDRRLVFGVCASAAQSRCGDLGCTCKRQCLVRQKYWLLCRGRVDLLAERVAAELAAATKGCGGQTADSPVHHQQQSKNEKQEQQQKQEQQLRLKNSRQAPPYTPIFSRPFECEGELSHAKPMIAAAPSTEGIIAFSVQGDRVSSSCQETGTSPRGSNTGCSTSCCSSASPRCSACDGSNGGSSSCCFLPPICLRIFYFLLGATLPDSRVDEIRRDVGRTFPTIPFFTTREGQQKLYDVLHALACLDPHTGYCQGMNFMVGALLQLCEGSRVHAFWNFLLFHRSLDYRLLHEGTMPLLGARTHQLDVTLKEHLPCLWGHLHRHWLSGSFFATQWLLACFTSFLDVSLVACVWDAFFACGWKAIARAAVAVFAALAPSVLQQTSLDHIIVCVQSRKHSPSLTSCRALLCTMEEVGVKNRHLSDISFRVQAELLLSLLGSLPLSFAVAEPQHQGDEKQHPRPEKDTLGSTLGGVGASQPASLRGCLLPAEALPAAAFPALHGSTLADFNADSSSSSGEANKCEDRRQMGCKGAWLAVDMRGLLTHQHIWEGTWLHRQALRDPSVHRSFALSDSLRDFCRKCPAVATFNSPALCRGASSAPGRQREQPGGAAAAAGLPLCSTHPAFERSSTSPEASSLRHGSSSRCRDSRDSGSSVSRSSSSNRSSCGSETQSITHADTWSSSSSSSGARYCLWPVAALRLARAELQRIDEETRSDLGCFQLRVHSAEKNRQQLQRYLGKQQRKLQQLQLDEETAVELKVSTAAELEIAMADDADQRDLSTTPSSLILPHASSDAASAVAAAAVAAHATAASGLVSAAAGPAGASAGDTSSGETPAGAHEVRWGFAHSKSGESLAATAATAAGAAAAAAAAAAVGPLRSHPSVRAVLAAVSFQSQGSSSKGRHARVPHGRAAASQQPSEGRDAPRATGEEEPHAVSDQEKHQDEESHAGSISRSGGSSSSSMLSLPIEMWGLAAGSSKAKVGSRKDAHQRKELVECLLKKVEAAERRVARAHAAVAQQAEACCTLLGEVQELTEVKDQMQVSMSAFIDSQEQKRLAISQRLLQQALWLAELPSPFCAETPQPLPQLLLAAPSAAGGDTAAGVGGATCNSSSASLEAAAS